MNTISLIGYLFAEPVYHCNEEGRDLTRFQLHSSNLSGKQVSVVHHCQAWGPAALDLHEHLTVGERLLIRGELRYRERKNQLGGEFRLAVIHVKEYTYLGC